MKPCTADAPDVGWSFKTRQGRTSGRGEFSYPHAEEGAKRPSRSMSREDLSQTASSLALIMRISAHTSRFLDGVRKRYAG